MDVPDVSKPSQRRRRTDTAKWCTAERGSRGGRCWHSLDTAMKASRFDEASLAQALTNATGVEVKPRRIDSYLRGDRCPDPQMLLAISRLVGLGVERLLADCPKNKFAPHRS